MSSPPPDQGNSPAAGTLQESLAAGKRPELTSSLVMAPLHPDCPLPSTDLQAMMTSQEQGQRNVQEDVAIGGKEEKRSRQRQGAGPKKMKKTKKGLSPVARHHVVVAMLSRSLAVRLLQLQDKLLRLQGELLQRRHHQRLQF